MNRNTIQVNQEATLPPWTRPSDWLDTATVGNNEINLLVTSSAALAFYVLVANSGTYSIDWGDGTVEHNRASNVTYQHSHTTNGVWSDVSGLWMWKVRIYNATFNITSFRLQRHNLNSFHQYTPVLSAAFGTQGITTYAYTFYTNASQDLRSPFLQECIIPTFANCSSTNYMFAYCEGLCSITLPESWGAVISSTSMFYFCINLVKVVLPSSWGNMVSANSFFQMCSMLSDFTLPATWGNITNVDAFFQSCTALSTVIIPSSWGSVNSSVSFFSSCSKLTKVTLPTIWGSITSVSGFFANCFTLKSVILPTSWGSVTNCSSLFQTSDNLVNIIIPASWAGITSTNSMFSGCHSLQEITLPAAFGASITSCSYMFQECYSLKTIVNAQYLGSNTSQISFFGFGFNTMCLTSISINSRLSDIGVQGMNGYPTPLTSIRLTNAASTFEGASPQVDVSFTNLGVAALDQLFTDLPTVTGKTIKITSTPGAPSCNRSIATAKGWTVTG